MLRKISFSLLLMSVLTACGDECREYSEFSCSDIQKASYNVYFYYPNGTEDYLGNTQGLSECENLAHTFAFTKELSNNSEWSYICCMQAKGSECYEKHR